LQVQTRHNKNSAHKRRTGSCGGPIFLPSSGWSPSAFLLWGFTRRGSARYGYRNLEPLPQQKGWVECRLADPGLANRQVQSDCNRETPHEPRASLRCIPR